MYKRQNLDAAVEHAQEQQALPLVVDDDGDGKGDADSPMVNYLSLVNARLMQEMKHDSRRRSSAPFRCTRSSSAPPCRRSRT